MMTMDEKLSAYLDDMLPEEERRALEALIAASPELAARLEALALANADFISHASAIDDLPMADGLQRQLQSLKAAADAGGGNVTPFRKPGTFARFFNDHRALAACAAVATGFFAWQSVVPGTEVQTPGAIDPGGLIIADSSLGKMFQTSASEASVELGQGDQGRVRFSFASANGDWCRVADVTAAAGTSRLVACQQEDGWQVVAAAYAGPADPQGTNVYKTASSQAASSIEAVLDTLMPEAPLGPEEEQALIDAGWRQTSPAP